MYSNWQFLRYNKMIFVLMLGSMILHCTWRPDPQACLIDSITQQSGNRVNTFDYIYITNLDWCPSCNMGFVEAFNKSTCDNVFGIFLTKYNNKKNVLRNGIRYPHAQVFTVKEFQEKCDLQWSEAKLYRISENKTLEGIDPRQIYNKLNKCH